MKNWTVFDRPTAEAARTHAENITESTQDLAEVMDNASRNGRTVVLVVPAGPDRATVARITPPNANVNE